MSVTTVAGETAWIRTRLDDGWSATPIAWDNAPFDPGSATAGYIRPLIRRTGATRADICPEPRQRYSGMLVIEVRTPENAGTAVSDGYVDTLEALFRDVSADGMRFFTPYTIPVGNVDGWYRQDVLCPFERDAIHS